MPFFVYILRSIKDGKLYIGQTNNLEDRLLRHNSGKVTATRNRRPLTITHQEEYPSRTEAMQREKYLKSLKGDLERKLNIKFE
ncbi:MAG: GIY-YIG nuclease family protein [Candidatus Moranbacteria bacterium]|nr:GIY-YIG nuclease family protein [Candidatus Moranbacteria bacterium]